MRKRIVLTNRRSREFLRITAFCAILGLCGFASTRTNAEDQLTLLARFQAKATALVKAADSTHLVTSGAELSNLLKTSKLPVLLEIGADYCKPCWVARAKILGLEKTFQGKFAFARLDSEGLARVASAFKITGVPTLILFRDGLEVRRISNIPMDPGEIKNQVLSQQGLSAWLTRPPVSTEAPKPVPFGEILSGDVKPDVNYDRQMDSIEKNLKLLNESPKKGKVDCP